MKRSKLLVRFQSVLKCVFFLALSGVPAATLVQGQGQREEDAFRSTAEPGRVGGRLVVGQSPEPRTLNPVMVFDQPSQDIIRRMMSDLIHINRFTQKVEPALARSWTTSRDSRQFTLELRRGIRFSDGATFNADDVVFSFKVYLDEKVHSPQRDLLLISDKPLTVEKLGPYTVRFTFPAPYAAAERVFDSLAMLPRHLLEKDYEEGRIGQIWNLATPPDKIVGLGPFRLKQITPGERIVLERNPYYWKVDAKGQRLPYLDEITFITVPSKDAQVVRFQAGETQIITPLSAENYSALSAGQQTRHYKLYDVGPGMEYNFLLLNQNEDTETRFPEVARKQKWFGDVRFRQAISAAIDRDAIVRLVYQNRGTALATLVTPGDKLWFNSSVHIAGHSIPQARQLLESAGFSWKKDGTLADAKGQAVEFTILASASNAQKSQMATLIQDDLKQLGMNVHVVTMEFRSIVDRIVKTHDYEAAMLSSASGDADPNPDMPFLISDGQNHFWHLQEKQPAPWQAEIDSLMQKQLVAMDYRQRKKLYDRVQEIMAREVPVIFLASPNILVGVHQDLGNVRPAIMDNYVLWNAEELFWSTPAGKH